MTIIYYLSIALFRWDMKWIVKLRSMWGITRLSLVFFLLSTLIFDGYHINNTVEHIQLIDIQLARISNCAQNLDKKPDIHWSLINKFESNEREVKKHADLICHQADLEGKPWLKYGHD